jgi:hypothetical protein
MNQVPSMDDFWGENHAGHFCSSFVHDASLALQQPNRARDIDTAAVQLDCLHAAMSDIIAPYLSIHSDTHLALYITPRD